MYKQLIAFCLCWQLSAAAQSSALSLSFRLLANGKELETGKAFSIGASDTVVLRSFRVYISDIHLLQDDKPVWREPQSYHLYDSDEPGGVMLQVPPTLSYDRIVFSLGLDSLTNVSGAMGGVLDPTKGMYWTWQSGYINCKVEGTSNRSRHPKQEFQLHLGGYTSPYATLRQISLPLTKTNTIAIAVDLSAFLSAAGLSQRDHVMSPGAEAVKLSKVLASCFSIDQP